MNKNGASPKTSPKGVEAWRRDVHPNAAELPESPHQFEGRPPAYTASVEASHDGQACCAFKTLEWHMRDPVEYDSLLRQSQQLRFVHWVAYCRTPDRDILEQERLRCPLKWCRLPFQKGEHTELVNHVATCSHLADGDYWCPYCQRDESFAPACTTVHSQSKNLRKHFLRNALQTIRRLGSKSIRKAIHPSRTGPPRESRRTKKRRCSEGQDSYHELGTDQETDKFELDTEEVKPMPCKNRLPVRMVRNSTLEIDDGNDWMPEKNAQPFTRVPRLPVRAVRDTTLEIDDGNDFGSEKNENTFEKNLEERSPVFELASDELSCPSMEWDVTDIFTPNSSLSPVSPVSPAQSWCRYTAKDFDSPISPTDFMDFTLPSFDFEDYTTSFGTIDATVPVPDKGKSPQVDHVSSNVQPTNLTVMRNNGMTRSIPNIRVDTSFNDKKPLWPAPSTAYEMDAGPQSMNQDLMDEDVPVATVQSNLVDSAEPGTKAQVFLVEDLRGIVNVLFKESVRKMCQSPVSRAASSVIKASPSAAAVFENGIAALRKVVQGGLPTTFWEVFGMSHLAYAAVISGQEEDLAEQFGEIFEDILCWSSAITLEEDKMSFLQLAHEIWSPESNSPVSTPIVNREHHRSYSSFQNSPTSASHSGSSTSHGPWPTSFHHASSLSGDRSSSARQDLNSEQELFATLKTGAVVRFCLQYLGTLEYAGLRFSITAPPSPQSATLAGASNMSMRVTRLARTMKENVTGPLIETMGLEGFIPAVLGAEKLLHKGCQLGLRGLELKLIGDGKRGAKSRSLYYKFVEAVAQHCDRTSMIIGREYSTRDEYYVHDIDNLLRIHHDLRAKAIEANLFPLDTADIFGDLILDSAAPSDSASSAPPRPFSFATNEIDFLASDFQHPNVPELGTPSNVSTPPIYAPPPSHASPASDPGEGSLSCPLCGKVLKGKTVWLQSNMQRHQREKHSLITRRLPCSVAECGKTFGRRHNLLHHLRTVHSKE